ncbi:MAG: universal stress protein [Desulfobacteraceae bacterium]|nr:MAG: universal stress protein [Desulfobacteraceae bacterium]
MARKIKVLIAVDGSESAMGAVRYAAHFFNPETTGMTLIHIMAELLEMVDDLKTIASIDPAAGETGPWQRKMAEQAQKMIESAESILIGAGYEKQSIDIKIQNREHGVAKDITEESGKHDALIIGRRGINDPTDIIVGATAYRMMSAIEHLPVVIVGDKPNPKHILIGFDGSENAFKALDRACYLMPRPDRDVFLCHVAPAINVHLGDEKVFSEDQEKKWADEQNSQMAVLMDKAKDRLTDAGFDPERIKTNILTGRTSRAVMISKTAENGHCGTVVIGRRGLSMIREFMMGRVTMKVLHKAHQQAVWIV